MCVFFDELTSVLISIPEISGFLFSFTTIEFQKKAQVNKSFFIKYNNKD